MYGRATLTLPRNAGGFGYVCYSRSGAGSGFAPERHAVTQDYEGASDLDIKPADNGPFVPVCRIWPAADKPIRGSLHFDATAWTGDTRIVLELSGPVGTRLANREYARATPQGDALTATAAATGWHTFRIRSLNTPAANGRPSYWLRVTYQDRRSSAGTADAAKGAPRVLRTPPEGRIHARQCHYCGPQRGRLAAPDGRVVRGVRRHAGLRDHSGG